MLLVHLSDLHLSRYGESGTWTLRSSDDHDRWSAVHTWQQWHVEGRRDRRGHPDRLRLVDPEGIIHLETKWPLRNEEKTIGEMLSLAMKRHLTASVTLIAKKPTREDLNAMIKVDPTNTNLRFLEVLDEVERLDPEIVIISGDTTDNGFGYRLVEHYFAPWIKRGALFVVPGNHDTYDMFSMRNRRARVAAKEKRYLEFATTVGNAPESHGGWVRYYKDFAFVGLSSCKPPSITLLNASGEVCEEQLVWLESLRRVPEFIHARFRLLLVHHHVLRMPFDIDKRHPLEVGIRLRNAAAVLESCSRADIDFLFNGHRHHGYLVLRPGLPTVVSSPSTTLGCKSTNMRYFWKMNLSDRHPHPEIHRLVGHRIEPEAPIAIT